MQDYEARLQASDGKVLDALERIKALDDSLAYRRSCREGVCGSDGININGRNTPACITALEGLREPVTLAPLPGFPVIRDLVVDTMQFFAHYHAIRPYLINDEPLPERERLQSPEERRVKLDGLHECILCACCSSFCPSYWWNPDKFTSAERLEFLDDVYKLYRCRTIMNCTEVCPKGLTTARATERIKRAQLRSSV